jgi:hypothetical protein
MDDYQLLLDGVAVGPIRESWDEAAHDAVLAGLAVWVDHEFPNSKAIQWSRPGRARIMRVQSGPVNAHSGSECWLNGADKLRAQP